MDVSTYLVGILLVIITYMLYKMWNGTKYWDRRGIKGPSGIPIFGSFLPVVLRQKSLAERWTEIYRQYKNERFIGAYNFLDPLLILTRPEDAETILIKEFSTFTDRSPPINEKVNPHGANLFGLSGSRWKALRSKVSPTFTTGRIKGMIPQVSECWENTDRYIQKSKGPHDLKDLTSMFTMDVISSVAFGIDSKMLGEPNTEFRKMTKEFFNFTILRLVVFLLNILYPKIAGLFGIPAVPRNVTNFFADITRNQIKSRRKNNIQRNDFLQLLMQLQEKGSVEVTKWDADDDYLQISDKTTTESIEITENIIISQAFIFFTAGYESTANTILFSLFEVCSYPKIKQRAIQEVESVISKHGSITYDALKDMVFLEMCIQETLRLHPAAANLTRLSNKDFTFPNSNLTLKAGSTVGVPLFAIHTDEQYWPEPFVFNPERFGPDKKIFPGTYLPFGSGPRTCVAMRFALLEVKVGLSKLLLNYECEIHPDTEIPIRLNKQSFLNSPISPVLFNLKRKHEKLL